MSLERLRNENGLLVVDDAVFDEREGVVEVERGPGAVEHGELGCVVSGTCSAVI